MQLSGTVVFWRDDKGFGFVLCEQSQQKLFFHIRDMAGVGDRPKPGDKLQFSLSKDNQQVGQTRIVTDNEYLHVYAITHIGPAHEAMTCF